MMRPGRCLAAIAIAGSAFALASCEVPAQTDIPADGTIKGEACSATNSSGMFQSTQYPAVDEGAGRVGLLYAGSGDVVMPDEVYGYYRLHDCRMGRAQGFDAYALRETRYRGARVSLEEFVAAARADGLMARPDHLMTAAKRAGFAPSGSDWNQQAIDEYAACACALFYPDLQKTVANTGATP